MGEENIKMDFTVFLSGLMADGLIALGLIKNPVTEKEDKDLVHASRVIDIIDMLKVKTAGNLTEDESSNLENILHQLRMGYIMCRSKGEKEAAPEKEGA